MCASAISGFNVVICTQRGERRLAQDRTQISCGYRSVKAKVVRAREGVKRGGSARRRGSWPRCFAPRSCARAVPSARMLFPSFLLHQFLLPLWVSDYTLLPQGAPPGLLGGVGVARGVAWDPAVHRSCPARLPGDPHPGAWPAVHRGATWLWGAFTSVQSSLVKEVGGSTADSRPSRASVPHPPPPRMAPSILQPTEAEEHGNKGWKEGPLRVS